MKKYLLEKVCTCVFAFMSTTSIAIAAPLESRLGGLAYYDPNLGITWAANANINGSDDWNNQVAWAAGLNIGGITGWRLPNADINGDNVVVDCFGGGVAGCTDNEMGFLYWEEGIAQGTPSPFSNVVGGYWSSTGLAPNLTDAWGFNFSDGTQFTTPKDIGPGFGTGAWAVYSGDVGVVPIPATAWLFGSGLLLLVRAGWRKNT